MKISGIELHPWMVEHAYHHIPPGLFHSLQFSTYQGDELPYKAESFDLAYSKGVLNHVSNKLSLFKKIHAVLKPQSLFVIADWIFPKIRIEPPPLVCETKETYADVLTQAGFKEIHFRDDSPAFITYAEILLDNLDRHANFIKRNYGEELFLATQKQHQTLIDDMTQHQKTAFRITAKKML